MIRWLRCKLFHGGVALYEERTVREFATGLRIETLTLRQCLKCDRKLPLR